MRKSSRLLQIKPNQTTNLKRPLSPSSSPPPKREPRVLCESGFSISSGKQRENRIVIIVE
ncbi:hypothetical protein Bca101_068710 [Brassica carinata]